MSKVINLNKSNYDRLQELATAKGTTVSAEGNRLLSLVDMTPNKKTISLSVPEKLDSQELTIWLTDRIPNIVNAYLSS